MKARARKLEEEEDGRVERQEPRPGRIRPGSRVRSKGLSTLAKKAEAPSSMSLSMKKAEVSSRRKPIGKKVEVSSRLAQLAQPRRRRTRKTFEELLPIEAVAELVFSFLEEESVLNAAQTCRYLLQICSSDFIWRQIWKRRYSEDPQGKQNLKNLILARRSQSRAKSAARAQSILNKITNRVGVENSLSSIVEAIEPELTLHVNGEPCDLLAFRRKSQQGTKLGFRVHSACPAPNMKAGILRYDLSTVLKGSPPASSDTTLRSLRNISVTCSCAKVKKTRRPIEVVNVLFSREQWTPVGACSDAGVRLVSTSFGKGSSVVLALVPGCGGEGVAMVLVNLHHADLLAGLRLQGHVHTPVYDDLDRYYGLHGYTCSIALRSFGQTWWSSCFKDLASKDTHSGNSVVRFPLLTTEACQADVTRRIEFKTKRGQIAERPSLYFRTETFTAEARNALVVDMAMWDEHGEVVWCVSRPINLQQNDVSRSGPDFRFDDLNEKSFQLVAEDVGIGKLSISCSQFGEDLPVIKQCHVELQANFIRRWFGISQS